MWVCVDHLKETLKFAKTPHVSKPRCQTKCSLCEKNAIVKLYYFHKTNDSLYTTTKVKAEV